MEDAVWVALTVAFFALSIAYVRFCERVKWGAGYEPGIGDHARDQRADCGLPGLRTAASGEIL